MLRYRMLPVNIVLAGLICAGCRTPTPTFNPFAGYGSPRISPPGTQTYGNADTYYPGAGAPVGTGTFGTGTFGTGTPAAGAGFRPSAVGSSPTAMNGTGWKPLGSRSDVLNPGVPNTGPGVANLSNAHLLAMPNPRAATAKAPRAPAATPAATPGVAQASYSAALGTPAAPTAVQPAAAATLTQPAMPHVIPATVPGQQVPTTGPSSASQSFLRLKPMPVNDATSPPNRFVPAAGAVKITDLPAPVRPVIPGSNNVRGFPPATGATTTVSPSIPTTQQSLNSAQRTTATSGVTAPITPTAPQVTQATASTGISWRNKFASTNSAGTVAR